MAGCWSRPSSSSEAGRSSTSMRTAFRAGIRDAFAASKSRTKAEAEGVHCSTVTVDDGQVVDEICRKASEYDAQLIVVGSHGWGAARRFLSGSVSTGLVHSAPCPVLVVRPGAEAREHAAAA